MTCTARPAAQGRIAFEPGRMVAEQPRFDLPLADDHALLEMTRQLPGNARLVRIATGTVQRADARLTGEGAALERKACLARWALGHHPPEGDPTADHGHLANIMESYPGSEERDRGWYLPGAGQGLAIWAVPGGVVVAAPLAGADLGSQGALCREAAAAYLVGVQGRLRFCRLEGTCEKLRARAFCASDRLDDELPEDINVVMATVALVERELAALGDPALAQAYLEFRRPQSAG